MKQKSLPNSFIENFRQVLPFNWLMVFLMYRHAPFLTGLELILALTAVGALLNVVNDWYIERNKVQHHNEHNTSILRTLVTSVLTVLPVQVHYFILFRHLPGTGSIIAFLLTVVIYAAYSLNKARKEALKPKQPFPHDDEKLIRSHSQEVIQLLQQGLYISAIAEYRRQTGLGLKEAKEAVDRLKIAFEERQASGVAGVTDLV